jgi:hypothetical protein
MAIRRGIRATQANRERLNLGKVRVRMIPETEAKKTSLRVILLSVLGRNVKVAKRSLGRFVKLLKFDYTLTLPCHNHTRGGMKTPRKRGVFGH